MAPRVRNLGATSVKVHKRERGHLVYKGNLLNLNDDNGLRASKFRSQAKFFGKTALHVTDDAFSRRSTHFFSEQVPIIFFSSVKFFFVD
jgi:hypothetical protein